MYCSHPVTQCHVGRPARSLSLFAETSYSSRLGACFPTGPRSSTPLTDLRHRTPMPDSGRGPHKVGPKRTYQRIGQSSDIGTIDPDVGDRHRPSPTEGEIGHWRSERYVGPREVGPRIILSQQLKH